MSPFIDNPYYEELVEKCQILPEASNASDIDMLYERKQMTKILEMYTPLNVFQSQTTMFHQAVRSRKKGSVTL